MRIARWKRSHILGPIVLGVGAALAAAAHGAGQEIPLTTSSEEARADFLAGQAALDRGDAAPANALFREALTRDPNFVYAWFNLGNVSFSTEEFAESVRRGSAAASHSSNGERLLMQVAQRFLDNDFQSQLATAQQLTEQYPRSPRAWVNLAGVQGGLNQYAEQRASLQKAVDIDASFTPAYLAMGNSYLFNEPRDMKQAENWFRKLIALAPGEDNYYWVLGDVYRASNRLEAARDFYKRATLLDPHDGTSPLKLGHVDSYLGRYDEARADYDRGIANAPLANRPFNTNYKMFTWIHQGEPARAVRELEGLNAQIDSMGLPADQRSGAKAFTLNNALVVALHHNMHEDARRVLDQFAAVLRSNAKAVGTEEFSRIQEANIAYFEGQLAARRGDYRAALTQAKKNASLVEAQSNPRKMENYNDLVGLINLLQGKHAAAIKAYRGADITNNIYHKYHLAMALAGAKQDDEARRLFKQVGEWNFNSVQFALVRKDALARATG
jgi:tetratricopeptide (TPR) repeat protein